LSAADRTALFKLIGLSRQNRHVRLRLSARRQSQVFPAPANPADQRRQPDPKISRDLALGPPTRQSQPGRLVLKFLRKPSLVHH
jgi:hypothetical protein